MESRLFGESSIPLQNNAQHSTLNSHDSLDSVPVDTCRSTRSPANCRPPSDLVDVAKLVTAYFTETPDPRLPSQRVAFGTSGHRGSSFDASFNEAHILAITQAICLYRKQQGIDGPLYLGIDTHALSEPALASALEVLAANGVDVCIDAAGGYTPTPVISHAILTHNRGRTATAISPTASSSRLRTIRPKTAASSTTRRTAARPTPTSTKWIEDQANEFLADGLRGVARMPFAKRAHAPTDAPRTTIVAAYVGRPRRGRRPRCDPRRRAASSASTRSAAPASRTGTPIGERYGLNLEVVNAAVDPTFRFMTRRLGRQDPHGSARQSVRHGRAWSALKDRFDVAFANDADADRHGIVTRGRGLLEPNHYLAVAIALSLRRTVPAGRPTPPIGKTLVSAADDRPRRAPSSGARSSRCRSASSGSSTGLFDGTLGFGGEESAGARFLRRDGTVWTTDKDGIVPDLLAAEITARTGRDPGRALPRARRGVRLARLHPHRRPGDARAEGAAPEALPRGRHGHDARRRADHRQAHQGTRQRRADRRPESRRRERLVRRAALGHREHLQDLRRELPRPARTWTRS